MSRAWNIEAVGGYDLDAVDLLDWLDARFDDLGRYLSDDFAKLEADDFGIEEVLGLVDSLFTVGFHFEALFIRLGYNTDFFGLGLRFGKECFSFVKGGFLFPLQPPL